MNTRREKLTSKTFRLPTQVVEFMETLTTERIFGRTESETARALLARAINDLIKEEYVRKHLETMRSLGRTSTKAGSE